MTVVELIEKIKNSDTVGRSYAYWGDVWASLDAKHISEEFYDETRWYNLYKVTVQIGDQFFQVTESRGATEYQENADILDDLDSLIEVEPVEVTTIQYLDVDRPKTF